MKQTLLAILLLATVHAGASDWLTRVGGGSGGGPQDPSSKAIAATESAPVAIRPSSISAAEMKKLFADQIVFMYALTENGMAVQIQRYRHDGGATWRRDPVGKRQLEAVRDTITYDDFVAAIKRNGFFDVLRDMPLPCPGCQGNGFAKSDGRDGRLAVRTICPACKGKKTTTKPLLCRISL